MKAILTLITFLFSLSVYAQNETKLVESIFGTDKNQKFSYHETNYFAFGDDDLKLQFGFKYRLARTFSFYFAYSQLMFWDIYDESKPFEDVNFKPEFFYRILEEQSTVLRSLDFGYLHTSNGRAGDESRSIDRLIARANIASKIRRHLLGGTFMVYKIFNEDETNDDIVEHLGYWNAHFYLTDILRVETQRLDLELMLYAGDKLINFDQGAYQLGFIYRFGSENFNPSLYLQRFEGYAENLLNYDKRTAEWRLGLMLSI